MAEDVFRSKGAVGGVYKGTLVALTLGGADLAAKGSLVQSISINYSRNVNRIWELGSQDTYYILGHTEGTAQLSRIVGRADTDILDRLADACESVNQVISMSSAGPAVGGEQPCPNSEIDFDITISGPVLMNRSFSISADNFLITEGANMMFASLAKGSGNS